MEVRGVGGINPMEQPGGKPVKASQGSQIRQAADSVNVSEEAAILRDEAFLKSVVAKVTAIDEKRVAEVRERLASGYYDRKEVLDVMADRMMKALGL